MVSDNRLYTSHTINTAFTLESKRGLPALTGKLRPRYLLDSQGNRRRNLSIKKKVVLDAAIVSNCLTVDPQLVANRKGDNC